MEEIVQKFETTLGPEKQDDSYKTLYKNWGKFGNQEQRRIDILQQQKTDRRNNLDTCRGILELIDTTQQSTVFKTYQSSYQPNVYVPGFSRSSKIFANILMHSEWLIEKPEDFSTNWYVTPCPSGTRMLVVAANGITKCYTKYGQFRFEIPTLLPGGNSQEKRRNCSVLDCFYHKETATMYVLDILTWNSHIMADGEMEFRHFWLRTKIDEIPGLARSSKRNKVMFSLLPMIPCNDESFQKFMMNYPPFPSVKLDGLLFYHKHGRYVPGETPLVGWLFPYMVPEILGTDIKIHPSYATGKPIDYVDQATFIKKFEAKISKRTFGKGNKNNSRSENSNPNSTMEAEDTPVVPESENIIEDEEILDEQVKEDTSGNEDKEENKKEENTDSKISENEPVTMEAESVEAAAGPSDDSSQVTENMA